ncbi:uncharacterized protein [Diadema setosum]|uniref:uncharacterized protein n=1 Tax=Diadema setosum TaxID=31175 RepID=UPI003B3A0611
MLLSMATKMPPTASRGAAGGEMSSIDPRDTKRLVGQGKMKPQHLPKTINRAAGGEVLTLLFSPAPILARRFPKRVDGSWGNRLGCGVAMMELQHPVESSRLVTQR